MASPLITFVFCVESGRLEGMGLRAIESLRRWGGSLAQSPVIVVTPRFGPPLDQSTLRQFGDLDIRYIRFHTRRRYRWNPFINKTESLLAAEEIATTPMISWLDDDILVVGEPSELILDPENDLTAAAPDKEIGTSGPGDPNDAYWSRVCEILGVDINSLPYVQTYDENQRIRLYWNSGVFTYRPASGLGRTMHEFTVRLLDAHLAHREKGTFYNDQVALAIAGSRLRWRLLPQSHNYTMQPWLNKTYPTEQLKQMRVLHFHHFMQGDDFHRFISILEPAYPEVSRFLRERGPLTEGDARWKRSMRYALKAMRSARSRYHRSRCEFI